LVLYAFLNVKSNPRMHQNQPVSGKNSIFFWEGSQPLPRPHPIGASTVRPRIIKFWIRHWRVALNCCFIATFIQKLRCVWRCGLLHMLTPYSKFIHKNHFLNQIAMFYQYLSQNFCIWQAVFYQNVHFHT